MESSEERAAQLTAQRIDTVLKKEYPHPTNEIIFEVREDECESGFVAKE